MHNDPNDSSFQRFLDQKMNEIKNGVAQNIIKKTQNKKQNVINNTENLDDVDVINSKFNQMMDDLRKQYPTLKQIKTQYPNE